jgi:hypothetical protein
MVRKHESSTLRLIVTLIHLTLGAQLGVLTRTFLSKLFVLGCGGGWGPCLQGTSTAGLLASWRYGALLPSAVA